MKTVIFGILLFLAGGMAGVNMEPQPHYVPTEWRVWASLICAILFIAVLVEDRN